MVIVSRRLSCAACAGLTICAGLASRRVAAVYAVFGKYPGDALWTAMVYFLIAAVAPVRSRKQVAGAALAVSFAVEVSQLVQHPWLQSVRSTTLGHLVLGSVFNAPDLVAYAAGALAALSLDRLLSGRTS